MTTAEKKMQDQLTELKNKLVLQDKDYDQWADVNAKLNIAAGLLLIVFLLMFIAYRLS